MAKSIRQMLLDNNWRYIETRKQGCFKHVLWMDEKTGWVMPQARAVETQRYRNAVAADVKRRTFVSVTLENGKAILKGVNNGTVRSDAAGQ